MELNLKLGEQVIVTGRYEKAVVTMCEVDKVERLVSETGSTVISDKYKSKELSKAKPGIVVGKRAIPMKRKHYQSEAFGVQEVITEPADWKTVYLIACDLRGLMYVSEWDLCEYDMLADLRHCAVEIEGFGTDYMDNVLAV